MPPSVPEHRGALLVQLPLNGIAALEPTGNIPYAGGLLAAAAGLGPGSVLGMEACDTLGDRALLSEIVSRGPGTVGFTLYCWNVERSVRMARALREALPGVRLVAGGPEVQPDNGWLSAQGCFDVLVSGEGEPVSGILTGGLPAAGMVISGSHSFPPGEYPDPWLSGILDPAAMPSVMAETVRGCASGCIYCSYRRSHPAQRIMPAARAAALARSLAAAGASEIVFIDPTFNARGDFVELLRGLDGIGIECFGEMRGEGVGRDTARMLAAAGFRSVEIGLQTWNGGALESCGRPSDPAAAAMAAAVLRDAGIEPVVDIIIGLPGDTPEGPLRAARELVRMGAGDRVQVFHLAALPGTSLRERTGEFGLEFMDRPPYYVTRTPWGGPGEIAALREEIADILGYDLDLGHRPLLFEGWGGTESFDLDRGAPPGDAPPSYRHGALRLACMEPWAAREEIRRHVTRRLQADPFCVLDVILEPSRPFPLDLLDMIQAIPSEEDYSTRTAGVHGRAGRTRPAIHLGDVREFDPRWLTAASACCPVVVDAADPSELPAELLAAGVGVRLPGTAWDLPSLESRVADPSLVHFESMLMEKLWCHAVLDL